MSVVVASGYFDPLHVGHVEYLEMAKNLAGEDGELIVIVNTDLQAIAKKGYVFMDEQQRIKIVEALRCVDGAWLSIDKDSTVCESLKAIKPDFFAKGGDRYANEIPESAVCKEFGIVIVDGLGKKIQSSSELVKRRGSK